MTIVFAGISHIKRLSSGGQECLSSLSSYYYGQSNWFCHSNASLSCSHKPWSSITVTNIEVRAGSGLASASNQPNSKAIQLVRHASNPNRCHAEKIQSSTSSIQIQYNRPNTSVPEVLTVQAARSSFASITDLVRHCWGRRNTSKNRIEKGKNSEEHEEQAEGLFLEGFRVLVIQLSSFSLTSLPFFIRLCRWRVQAAQLALGPMDHAHCGSDTRTLGHLACLLVLAWLSSRDELSGPQQ